MPTIVLQPSASNHDCLVYQDIFAGWHLNLADSSARGGYKSPGQRCQVSGLYFPDTPIPPGSEIFSAYLIFRASDDRDEDGVRTVIEAEESASPVPFTDLADFQSRVRIRLAHSWPFVKSPWVKDNLYVSPDFHDIIQEVIELPGWSFGNPIVVFWGDDSCLNPPIGNLERAGYSFDGNASEAPRLEITFEPVDAPPPPPPPRLPPPPPPPRKGWAGLDFEYEWLDTGFRFTLHTDTPCHLWCRMTTTPPLKHALPSMRRGLRIQGDVRFCFVVYEDNEQEEDGDTLLHTFTKPDWPVCETRWFYFVGTVYGNPSPSETAIYKFHFTGPPPPPPEPVTIQIECEPDARTIRSNWGTWPPARNGIMLRVLADFGPPRWQLTAGWSGIVSYFVTRSLLRFDTSAIPDDATIISASVKLWVITAGFDAGSLPNIYVEAGLQSTPVVTGDWYPQNPASTIFALKDLWTVAFGYYNYFPLNADGIAHIDKVGVTKFSVRGQNDYDNVDPGLMARHSFNFHSYFKGFGYRPILEVKYLPA